MRARFVAGGHEGQVCTVFGRDFPHGTWVEAGGLEDEAVLTLMDNPCFEVDETGAAEDALKRRPRPAKLSGAPGLSGA